MAARLPVRRAKSMAASTFGPIEPAAKPLLASSSAALTGVIEHFDSAHLLPGHPKCGVPHGHTYKVEVTVEGPLVNGMVIDFNDLKRNLRELLATYDHIDLNTRIPYPTCENISESILKELKARLPQGALTVRLWEGDGKWAEISA